MKFCISNLAWNINEETNVLKLIKDKIKLLEYSPSLLIKDQTSKKDILKTKTIWKKKKNLPLFNAVNIIQ